MSAQAVRLVSPHTAQRTRRRMGPVATAGWRLSRRGRLVVTSLVAALVVTFVAALTTGGAARGEEPARTVVVQRGETLDAIAARYLPDRPRFEAVMLLDRANHLNSTHVEAGQRLVIPEP